MKTEKTDNFAEMLIDLNLTKVLGSGHSDTKHQTDMIKFMIIEVLLDIDHTYWYDFELFFYVLIWLCT